MPKKIFNEHNKFWERQKRYLMSKINFGNAKKDI